ncbi:MAG: glutamine ABC transporter substrate-binding protein GlnH [Rickettsiales bacterium]|nr:MAG: glutamine ABC transporter substrate-binding protein GlnH [Rickettsiales bacterium]
MTNKMKKSNYLINILFYLYYIYINLIIIFMKKTFYVFLISLIFTTMAMAKKIVVGIDGGQVPYTFINYNEKKYVGFNIDLFVKILTNLNYQIEIKNMSFDNLFTDLMNKKIDIIGSAIIATNERKKIFLFSDLHLISNIAIMVRKTDTEIKDYADLKGRNVGVKKESIQEKTANNILIESKIIPYSQNKEYDALIAGDVDAIIVNVAIANYMINVEKSIEAKIVGTLITNNGYGFMVRKDKESEELIKKMNKQFEILKIEKWYQKNVEKWFGKDVNSSLM